MAVYYSPSRFLSLFQFQANFQFIVEAQLRVPYVAILILSVAKTTRLAAI